jgi:prevent-host-death family protein
MKKIGTFEAKTHLSALLDEVERGVEVVITRRGVAVARLVPAGAPRRTGAGDPIARAKAFAMSQTLEQLSWKRLRDEGRR